MCKSRTRSTTGAGQPSGSGERHRESEYPQRAFDQRRDYRLVRRQAKRRPPTVATPTVRGCASSIPDSDALGWVFASLVTASGDASALDSCRSDPGRNALHADAGFLLQAPASPRPDCEQAPQDGILIQTPQGVGQINLRANDVDVQLGSTAYLQAQPSGNMTVSVVEGEGHVTAQGQTVVSRQGRRRTIPMDANLQRVRRAERRAALRRGARCIRCRFACCPKQITIAAPAAEATEVPTAEVTARRAGSIVSSGAYSVQKIMDLGGETPFRDDLRARSAIRDHDADTASRLRYQFHAE